MTEAKKPNIQEGVETHDGKKILWRALESEQEVQELSAFLDKFNGQHQMKHFHNREGFVGRKWESEEDCRATTSEQHDKTQTMFDECVESLRHIQFPRPEGIQRRPRIREDGERLDLQRHRDGDPLRYWHTKKVKRPGGHSTVVVAQCCSIVCSGDSWKVTWRGAAGAALTQLLHDAGYQVEYWLFFRVLSPFKNRDYDYECGVKIKDANAPPDFVRMANLTSCWWYRSHGFSLKANDRCPKKGGGNGGLGSPTYYWKNLKALGDKIAKGRPVLCIEGKPFSKEAAVKCVEDVVKKFVDSF